MSKKILVVEDNEDIRILYRRLFRKQEIEILEAADGESAYSVVKDARPDMMIIDISLPGISGIDLTKNIHVDFPEIKILIVTGHEVSRYYDYAIKAGADDVLSKENSRELVNRCIVLLK